LWELNQTASPKPPRFWRLGGDQVDAHEPDGTGTAIRFVARWRSALEQSAIDRVTW
jgi:hypothetical protein